MNYTSKIARAYFFSKKKNKSINWISVLAVTVVTVIAAAIIIILSAFNGLEDTLKSLYHAFDAPIKITSNEGKFFDWNEDLEQKIRSVDEVGALTPVLEQLVFLENAEKALPAKAKGVQESFLDIAALDRFFVEGDLKLKEGTQDFALLGYQLANRLDWMMNRQSVKMSIPKRQLDMKKLDTSFHATFIPVSASFSVAPEYDQKYIIVPLDWLQEQSKNPQITSVELAVTNEEELSHIKSKLQEVLGASFQVQTRYELNQIIFQTNQSEKYLTLGILSFILLIATFSINAALSMLILEKIKDIKILLGFGTGVDEVKKVFSNVVLYIIGSGALLGLILGTSLVLLQEQFGWVKVGGMVTDAYPVSFHFSDLFLELTIFAFIALLASTLPVKYFLNRALQRASQEHVN